MPNNVYSEINLHLAWHTKGSEPLIEDAVEHHLYSFLKERVKQTPEAACHAVGGTANHVHVAVSIPPAIHISEWVGQLKGSSAHYINHRIANKKLLEWQSGYGAVSFGSKDLPWVVSYVQNQKDRHAQGKTQDRLERIADGVRVARVNGG
jgi:REP element-mobilizing transposase RayT